MIRYARFLLVAAMLGLWPCMAIAQKAANRAVFIDNAPIFLTAQSTEPLRVAAVGTTVILVKTEGQWHQVQFQDPQYGLRAGYVQTKFLRVESAAPQPLDLSVPSPASAPVPLAAGPATAAPLPSTAKPSAAINLRAVRRLYIEKMENDLDQYIAAEISKQMNGRVTVVLDKPNADAILRGVSENRTGTGAAITGRYLGLHDNANASITLVDPGETVVLWASEAGDRSLLFGVMKRGGQRKVADRLVNNLKNAIDHAK